VLHDLQGLGSLTTIWRTFSDTWDSSQISDIPPSIFESSVDSPLAGRSVELPLFDTPSDIPSALSSPQPPAPPYYPSLLPCVCVPYAYRWRFVSVPPARLYAL
jgi:hypothetical protein